MRLIKIHTNGNPADILTNRVSTETLQRHLQQAGSVIQLFNIHWNHKQTVSPAACNKRAATPSFTAAWVRQHIQVSLSSAMGSTIGDQPFAATTSSSISPRHPLKFFSVSFDMYYFNMELRTTWWSIVHAPHNMSVIHNMLGTQQPEEFNNSICASFGCQHFVDNSGNVMTVPAAFFGPTDCRQHRPCAFNMTSLTNIAVTGEPTYVQPATGTLSGANIVVASTIQSSEAVNPNSTGQKNGATTDKPTAWRLGSWSQHWKWQNPCVAQQRTRSTGSLGGISCQHGINKFIPQGPVKLWKQGCSTWRNKNNWSRPDFMVSQQMPAGSLRGRQRHQHRCAWGQQSSQESCPCSTSITQS